MPEKVTGIAGKLKANQHFADQKDFADAAQRWRNLGYVPIPLHVNAKKKLVPAVKWKELNIVT